MNISKQTKLLILDGMLDTALIYNKIKKPETKKRRYKVRLKKHAYCLGQQKALEQYINDRRI